jgi:hypothetical protein
MAMTIHIGMFFYTIFLFVSIDKKMNWYFHFIIAIVLSFFIFRIMIIMLSSLGAIKIQNILSSFSIPSAAISSGIFIFNYGVIRYFDSKPIKLNMELQGFQKYENLMHNCNVLMFYLIPFCIMTMNTTRLFRNFYLLNIIYLLNKIKISPKKMIDIDILVLILYFGFFFYFFEINGKVVILDILYNNALAKF